MVQYHLNGLVISTIIYRINHSTLFNILYIFAAILFIQPFESPYASSDITGISSDDPVIRYVGNHAILSVERISDRTFQVTLHPLETIHSSAEPLPKTSLVGEFESRSLWNSRTIMDPVRGPVGDHTLEILRTPLRIILRDQENTIIQQLTWPESSDGRLEFKSSQDLVSQSANGEWQKIERETNGESFSEEMTQTSPSVLLDPSAGWALFYHYPEEGTILMVDDEKGVFTPDPDNLTSPVQIFLTLWEDTVQLRDEFQKFAGEPLLELVNSAIQNMSDHTEENP